MKPLYVKKNGVVYKISGNGMPASYPAENVEYDNTVTSELQATDVQGAIDELSTRQDTNTKNTAYGTCDTAGNVKDKVATLSNATNWVLEVGTIVGIRFTYTNTYTPSSGNAVTLNVNNTGAKNIRYGNNVWIGSADTKCPTAFGEADQTIYYMYDGTYWVWVSHSKDNDTLYNFVGREFRSCNFNDAGLATGFGGDANLMVVNGVYYYNSNGPSTSIGASANDGSVFVHVCDDGYVVQIAQNYETGNIFVRAMNDNVWGAWKKPNANITGNNVVLTTDKTPFLTRQTLNPTGFSGYVREKLIGASYAWNQQVEQLLDSGHGLHPNNFSSISVSNGLFSFSAGQYSRCGFVSQTLLAGHKYLVSMTARATSGSGTMFFHNLESGWDTGSSITLTSSFQTLTKIYTLSENRTVTNSDYPYRIQTLSSCVGEFKNVQFVDLTLAFGSTIADHLYSLANNGGITKLRDMGCPIDKYTPYGYGLYSVKTSGKKIVGKNLFNPDDILFGIYLDGVWRMTEGTPQKALNCTFAPNTQYTFTGKSRCSVANANTRLRVVYTDGTTDNIFLNSTTSVIAFSMTSSASKSIDYIGSYYGNNGYVDITEFQIEKSATATTYEPYSSTTYPLGNDELRGKFDLVNGEIVASGDVKESNGNTTRRMALFDMGSSTWHRLQGGSGTYILYTSAIRSTAAKPLAQTIGNIVCERYVAIAQNSYIGSNKTIYIDASGDLCVIDNDYTDMDVFKTAMSGVYLVYELATPTTEQSTPFADPMSLVGATTEEYIDTRDIPCPVGAERQYMGQSEDVVEIPSTPQSDGIRYLKSYKSGNQEQLVWEGEGIEDVSSYFTEGICDDFEVGAVRYGRVISFNMACTPINGGNYIAVIKTYVPAYALSHVGSINVCAQSASGLHIDAVVSRYTDAAARIKFYTNETLSADEKIYVSGTYICDIIK